MYVDAAADGEGNGTTWAEAFDEAQFEADLEANAEAGDIYYVKAGTYTLDSAYDSTARDATVVAPISIIGVKAATSAEPPVLADWGSGADRPTFICGANAWTVGDHYKIFNCIFTATTSTGISSGTSTLWYNCKSTNTRGTPNYAFAGGTIQRFISCEGISASGTGFCPSTGGHIFLFCYAHDSTQGINCDNKNYVQCLFNIIDTCTTGILLSSGGVPILLGNTIYNCTTGLSATTAYTGVFVNNIIDTATDGFKWTITTNINFFAYNHEGNNVTEMFDTATAAYTLFHGDQWATTPGDPKFTDAAGGDFSLASDSPCIDAGMTITLGVG